MYSTASRKYSECKLRHELNKNLALPLAIEPEVPLRVGGLHTRAGVMIFEIKIRNETEMEILNFATYPSRTKNGCFQF